MDHLPSLDHLHSSANSNVLRSAASPEVLEAALEAAERRKNSDVQEPKGLPGPGGQAGQAAGQKSSERTQAAVERAQHANQQAPADGLDTAADPSPRSAEIARRSSDPPPAGFQAVTALTEGGRDAVRAWLALAQNAARTNVEALSRLSQCRSWSEAMDIQGSILQAQLQPYLEFGVAVARASALAVWGAAEATRHAPHGGAAQPSQQ